MTSLPAHGRIDCNLCHTHNTNFDGVAAESACGKWRIRANPLAWGNPEAEIVVLGFSKGQTQSGALASSAHDAIAFKGGRAAAGKILAHVSLIPPPKDEDYGRAMDRLIANRSGRFHFGSLVRCSVERWGKYEDVFQWLGTGGGMLDKFTLTDFGRSVTSNCSTRFLGDLPPNTKLVVMFGTGSELGYVGESRRIVESLRPGPWRTVNDVAYSDGLITVVHVEHFAVRGPHLKNWLGANGHDRARFGSMAREAVLGALSS